MCWYFHEGCRALRGARHAPLHALCPWLAEKARGDFRVSSGTLGAMHCKPLFLYALLAAGLAVLLLDTDQ
eukprot:gene27074-36578_t